MLSIFEMAGSGRVPRWSASRIFVGGGVWRSIKGQEGRCFGVVRRCNRLKRLNPAKANQGNSSRFLGRVWFGSGRASLGLGKSCVGLAKAMRAERSIFVTQPFDIASVPSLSHELLNQLLDASLDPPRSEPLGRHDRQDVVAGALKVMVNDYV